MRVRYRGALEDQGGIMSVHWGGNDDPRPLLTKGAVYEVAERQIHTWHTKIRLNDVSGWFNDASFEYLDRDEAIDRRAYARGLCGRNGCTLPQMAMHYHEGDLKEPAMSMKPRMIRPPWNPAPGGAVLCPVCGCGITSMEGIHACWQAGHFDRPEESSVTAERLACARAICWRCVRGLPVRGGLRRAEVRDPAPQVWWHMDASPAVTCAASPIWERTV